MNVICISFHFRDQIVPPRQKKKMEAQYVSNNLELVRRGREHQGYVDSYANTTLRAEYNLTEQIYVINQENTITAHYSWVKGHQGNTKNNDELSLLAQLNVEADALARKFQEDWKPHPKSVCLASVTCNAVNFRGCSHKPIQTSPSTRIH